MENLILIIFLILVICFMFLIIMNKQNPEQLQQSYIGRTILIPYYRWWWPYYYGSGSGSSTYYSTYRYPRHTRHRHRRHKHKHSKKNSITIIADRTGKTHVASRNSSIPVTVSGKSNNIRIAKSSFTNTKSNNNKIILLKKSKTAKK